MSTDTSVNNLVINKLTKAQYNGIATKSETELYLVPDEIDTVPTSGSSNPITSGSVYTALQSKQDIISDLSTIRNGAALGATALQSYTETDPTVPNWAKVFPIITGDSASNVNNLQFLSPFKGTMGTGSGDAGRFKIGLYTTDGNTSLPADNTLITSIASQSDPGQAWGHATDDTIPTIGLVYNKFSEKADKVIVMDASTLPSSLDPNKVYQMGTLTGSVTIPAFSAVASGNNTEVKIWCFTFNTSTTAPTITWPAAITNWVGGSAPIIDASKKYEVTVMDGIGAIMEA